jgi:DNA invertase Pin-like site-specific DNA recombinase
LRRLLIAPLPIDDDGDGPTPPRKVDDPDHIAVAKRMKADGQAGRDIAKYLGVSRATLYRYLT